MVYNKKKLFNPLDNWSREKFNSDFLEKHLEIVSPPHLVYVFSKKMLLMLHSINWPNFIAWLPLVLEILGNMCIGTVCLPGCEWYYKTRVARYKLRVASFDLLGTSWKLVKI